MEKTIGNTLLLYKILVQPTSTLNSQKMQSIFLKNADNYAKISTVEIITNMGQHWQT